MKQEQFLIELRVYIARNFKTQTAYAKQLGVSKAYLSGICTGGKKPSKRILSDMGITRTVSVDYIFKI